MLTTETPEIVAAVDWWTGILRARPPQDNGDAMTEGFMNGMIERFIPKPTDEQLTVFARELPQRIIDYLGKYGSDTQADWEAGRGFRVLSVDYHPCEPLAAAARVAGIADLNFPVKTTMWLDPGRVTVSHGYRAPLVAIYEQQ